MVQTGSTQCVGCIIIGCIEILGIEETGLPFCYWTGSIYHGVIIHRYIDRIVQPIRSAVSVTDGNIDAPMLQMGGEEGGQNLRIWQMQPRAEAPRQRQKWRKPRPDIVCRSTWIWLRTESIYGTPVIRDMQTLGLFAWTMERKHCAYVKSAGPGPVIRVLLQFSLISIRGIDAA